MLRRRSKSKPKPMKDFHDRIAQLGCLVCGAAATIHHVTATIHGGRITRRDDRVVPLCPMHHQKVYDPLASDPVSVEGLSHKGFFMRHGIDLLAEAERLANG
jgi:5-methylcytosine-specific restriction endonuclease McrA